MKKDYRFLEGVAYRLGQLQSHLNCFKCRNELHLLEIEINQYLLVESSKHRKEYYKDIGVNDIPTKAKMKEILIKWKAEGNS